MKKHFTISLIVMGIAAIVAIWGSISGGAAGFVIGFGLTCIAGAGICLFIGLIMLLTKDRELARSMLISTGILLLIGTGVCSTLFGMNLQH